MAEEEEKEEEQQEEDSPTAAAARNCVGNEMSDIRSQEEGHELPRSVPFKQGSRKPVIEEGVLYQEICNKS